MSRVLECSTLEKEILTKVKRDTKDKKVTLAIISFNDSKYCELLIDKCLDLDVYFRCYKLYNSNTSKVTSLIDELNKDSGITGILLVEPIPKNIDKYSCYEKIDINKDIDGVNPLNQYYLSINRPRLINSTVLAVIKILEFYNISLSGKNVTIIGRSYNLSKPLTSYLINSDIVISATGVNNLFKSSDLKDECVVIDVGLGDVLIDSDTVSYTLRFKGIGPLSIACLLENLVTTCKDKK